jgi:hypothetical protein
MPRRRSQRRRRRAGAGLTNPFGGRVQRGLDTAWGVAVALFGATFATVATVNLITGGDSATAPGSLVGLTILFTGIMIWGLRLVRRAHRSNADTPHAPAPAEPDTRSRVLAFAKEAGGRVTALEVAAHCGLAVADAKTTLDALVVQDVAALHVTDSGVLVYVFGGRTKPSNR